ncbi:MAG: hypothetical protein WCW68_02900 [Methanothrix sp.]
MNKGIIVQGNAIFSAVNVAVGDKAKVIDNASDHSSSKEEIIKQLDEINHMLMDCRDHFDNVIVLIEDIITIKEEMKKEAPDKAAIGTKINNLSSSVSSIANIAAALNTIKTAIFSII